MNKLLVFAVLLVAILVAPSSSSGLNPAQNSNQDVSMLFARQAEDPVRIVQASFGADNMLLDAHLENKSHNKIQSYRLGWAAVKKDDVRIGKGELVTVPQDVDTTAAFDIPGQGVPGKEDLSKHPTGVVLYVAELQFQDGSKWQADIKKIKKEAIGMVK